MAQITDEMINKPSKGSSSLANVKRSMIFDAMVIDNNIPKWLEKKTRRFNTLPNLTPSAARIIIGLFNTSKLRPTVTAKIAQIISSGQLQRTAALGE